MAAALAAERAALAARCEALGGELAAVTGERDAARAERDALALRLAGVQRERDQAVAQADATRRQAAPPPERIGLVAALEARGLATTSEQTMALALLASSESGPAVLATLEGRDPAALRSALERRLALVCGDPGCRAPDDAAAIVVEPARCEVCGGSDIQRAARGFAEACARAAITRVRFVGGSPNYRTKLAALFPAGGAPTVLTTAGDRKVPLHRSKAQQRTDDLVIIWGATELDHATSGAYRAQHGRVEVIAHRGIGRMLELAARRLTPA